MYNLEKRRLRKNLLKILTFAKAAAGIKFLVSIMKKHSYTEDNEGLEIIAVGGC